MEVTFTDKEREVINSFFPQLSNLSDGDALEKMKEMIFVNSRQTYTSTGSRWSKKLECFEEALLGLKQTAKEAR